MSTSAPTPLTTPTPEAEARAREATRKLQLLRVAARIGLASSTVYGLAYLTNAGQLWLGTLVCALTSVAHTVVLRLPPQRHKLGIGLFLVACNAQIAVVTWLVGPGPFFHAYYFAFVASVFLVTPRAWSGFYAMAAVSCALLLAADLTLRPEDAVATFPAFVEVSLRAFTIVLVCASLAYIVAQFDADTRSAELAQEREHARSERLLLNILPVDIAERLKSDPANIADRHEDVTVLFADLAGFTDLSEATPPDELVAMLSEVFATFDDLADQCGLEKIKTIGDAYMAAAGMRAQPTDPACAAARMGLAMIEAIHALNERRGWRLAIRVGLHSGPAVAGVIGRSKFAYDLWGDTVNTASRMESHGVAGRVHATATAAAKLRDRFELELRGTIPVKGKGELETWFVVAEHDEAAAPSSRAAAALARARASGRPVV